MSRFSTDFISTSARDRRLVLTLNGLFHQAIKHNFSDIHFETQENGDLLVRAREDGDLHDLATLSPSDAHQVIEKIRARSKLSNVDYRAPQSGKFVQSIDDKTFSVRVSIINTDREDVSIVLRLQDRDNAGLPLDQLGMTEKQQDIFNRAVHDHQGMILNTGPTGSGKTTTLYAGLQIRNDRETKLITIEDPIEYHLHGAVQIEVGTGTGKSFVSVLREVLRQDPDVVLVGEIRDQESATIACQAAQTGHLLFSTLHTNSAIETIERLVLLGVPDYTIHSIMRLFVAQRLLRKPCVHCQELVSVDAKLAAAYHSHNIDVPDRVAITHGCDACKGKGYKGRFPIFEMLLPSQDLFHSIPDQAKMLAAAKEQPQFQTLAEAALEAVRDLRTTPSELDALRLFSAF